MDVKESGTQIRVPSTANLMVDSVDRVNTGDSANNCNFVQNQSILNGFFNRIATTEVVLEWDSPNISTDRQRNEFSVNGAALANGDVLPGFYNVNQLVQAFVANANLETATTGITFTANAPTALVPYATITMAGAPANVTLGGAVPSLLGIAGTFPTASAIPVVPGQQDLRPFRYLDFVSAQLTYNQELKDASTFLQRDVLCRWYFDFDQPPTVDAWGYPILMGYTPFRLRRLFSPAKQIKWDLRQPVGQMSVQVYSNLGPSNTLAVMPDSEWLMTLQVSEN